jgi:imidazolonepropionase-like amidohydrolase
MLAIRAGRMFDGLRLHDRPQILVAGDRIADIDFTGAQPPPGYQLIDLGEATLLPVGCQKSARLVSCSDAA